MKWQHVLVLLTWMLFAAYCEASLISLTSSANVITPPLTRTLKMDCALFDTEKAPTGSNGLVGRDVTSTSSDVSFVTSIVLMRNGTETIASVTQLDPVQWQTSISSLSVVKGNLSRSSNGMKGFIELQWDYPSVTDAGNYTCEVNAITRDGHNVVFKKTVTVKHSPASIADVITSVAALHKQMDQMAAAVAAENARHSEQGVLYCGSSNSWVQPSVNSNHQINNFGSYEREILVNQTFSQAYDNKPLIQIGVISVDSQSSNYGSKFGVELADVSEQGFSIRCYTDSYRNYPINNMTVSWLSIQ